MEIKEARFLVSNSKASQCPSPNMPEYAFIGRSNVGKSSLINMLCNNRSLAKVSGTPGKTQLINHFAIDRTWYLVDLPGYGYAKVSKSLRSGFASIITSYLETRPNIVNLFVLVDLRLEPQKIDLEFMRWLGKKQIPFSLIFTKADKLKPSELESNLLHYKETLLAEWEELPHAIVSSAEKRTGRQEILDFIDLLNQDWTPSSLKKPSREI
ncbi:MAG: ribosome biogenesis GTP-binding protein YihA/YsxC [Breznakibacter sp.]